MGPSQPIDVSILIVSYNTRVMTLAALDAVAKRTHGLTYEVIVVDNASNDGSADAIANHQVEPQLVTLSKNVGFAEGTNRAAEIARGEYLLLLNPDTLVLDGAIDNLVAFARAAPDAKIWGGRTLFADCRLNPSSCWGRMTLWNLFCRASGLTGLFPNGELFNGEALGGWPRHTIREVDIVSGCFFLIKRDFWNALGGFDPKFFMYGEEADLCLRGRSRGARPMVTPAATIVHYGGASENARADKMVKLLAAKASLINRHFSKHTRSAGLALLAGWPLSRWLALSVIGAVTGSSTMQDAAAVWQQIWNRRAEWQAGYVPLHADNTPSAFGPIPSAPGAHP